MNKRPFFGDDVKAAMQWLLENHPDEYAFVSQQMWKPQLGVQPRTGGSCTSQNCFGTTGCRPLTNNGYCACSGPDGPCVWVPGV